VRGSRELSVRIEARYEDETIWLSQKLMAELFGINLPTVVHHLNSTISSGELDQNSVIRKRRITGSDGKNYSVQHYNLDAIISVGYRVNALLAGQRQDLNSHGAIWAEGNDDIAASSNYGRDRIDVSYQVID